MRRQAAEVLALRRQLLVMQSKLRRLQLQYDVRELRALSSPLALVARWTAPAQRPSRFALLAVVVASAWQRWMIGRSG